MERKKGFVIAGTHSGSGKTTISLGLMAWLRKQAYRVTPFKVGPDFIDPGHHSRITGVRSRNLDGWILSREYNLDTYHRFSAGADISVIEGVMGLYDGYDGKSEAGSTAQMAKWLDLPVILVINARSMARSVAALIKGFVEFDPDLNFVGVLFNNLGSERHYQYLADAAREYVSVPVLGGIMRNDRLSIPERHLGLVTDDEHQLKQEDIDLLADSIGRSIDTGKLVNGVQPSGCGNPEADTTLHAGDSAVRIGVPRDAAFCFYYQDNLDMLERFGATLVFFSPMEDRELPGGLAGLYFGGGYPEMFAAQLSENRDMRTAVKWASDKGMPIYGECGGFMYLCTSLLGGISPDDTRTEYPMAGCFPCSTRVLDSLKALGYREVHLENNTILGRKGAKARGHEFHYSEIIEKGQEIKQVYAVSGRMGKPHQSEGFSIHNTLGSYVHLHFGSNPEFARHFVMSCKNYMNGGKENGNETG